MLKGSRSVPFAGSSVRSPDMYWLRLTRKGSTTNAFSSQPRSALARQLEMLEKPYPGRSRQLQASGAIGSPPPYLVGTHPGPTLSAADSMLITLHGRGAHGSMPQAAVDPVVLAAVIVVRFQTVETRPGEPVVVTVRSIQAGTKSNVIPDHTVIELNVRTYSEATRTSSSTPSKESSTPNARRQYARTRRTTRCSTASP